MELLRSVGRGAVDDGIARASLAWRAVLARLRTGGSGDERGQGLAEYALILAFIAIVAIAALAFFGLQLSSVLTDPVGTEFGGVVSIITP